MLNRNKLYRHTGILGFVRLGLALMLSLWGMISFPAAFAQEDEEADRIRNYLEEEHALSTEFETPHTTWAKPYVEGATNVLFFAPWQQGSTKAREIIELMQRFDLEAQAVYLLPGARLVGDGKPDWYGGNPEAGAKRALDRITHVRDVIFINQIGWKELPESIREAIQKRVVEGVGLVIIGGELPFTDATPETTDIETPGAYYRFGRGRIALLPLREALTFSADWETRFDYQMARQGKALLWAARRLHPAHICLEGPESVDRTELPRMLSVSTKDLPAGTTLRFRLRRSDGECRDLTTISDMSAGAIPLPRVSMGEYRVEAFARKDGKTITWADHPLTVGASRQVEFMEPAKDWAEIGEKLTLSLRLTGTPYRKEALRLRILDGAGRILEEHFAGGGKDTCRIAFKISPAFPMLVRLEAAVLEKEEEAALDSAYLRITHRHREQFNFVVWNMASDDLAPYSAQSLARYGATAILQGGAPPLGMAAADLAYVPYAASFRDSSHTTTAMLNPETGILKSGCVYDKATMDAKITKTVEGLKEARGHGVLVYSLGDENAVRASCLSPECLTAYRAYLHETYGDIAALNREWNTGYTAFDDIELLSEGDLPAADAPQWFREYYQDRRQLHRTDSEGAQGADLEKQLDFGDINDEMRALQAGNFARWYDRQAFQNHSYVAWCKQYRKAFRDLDPQAWTGFEGTDSFAIRRFTTRSRQGGDIDLFMRELDYFGPYTGPANELVRSIARPGFPTGNWIGYTADAEELLQEYWEQVTDGMNTVQWWRWDNLDGYHGYLTPALAPYPAVKTLLDDTQVVRDGLGALLQHSALQDDAVALLYSLPSTYIAHFDGNESYGDYARDHDTWRKLIHRAGLQFRYVTDRMMRLDEFDAARYKVLILPLAFAMDEKEIAVVRRFVADGGTVIADIRPALYDGHCKPRETGGLDDLFGILRGEKREALAIDRIGVDGDINGRKITMRWGNWHGKEVYPPMYTDPAVTLTTGKAAGDAFHVHYWSGLKTPTVIVNSYGKGRAILLNFSVQNAPAEKLIAGLLASAGVTPTIQVARENPTARGDIEITRWCNGDQELLALLGDYEGNLSVTIPQAAYVGDIKSGVSLGHTDRFTAKLQPHRAAFFTLTPKAPAAPILRMKSAAHRGDTVTATIAMPKSEAMHAVTLRAIRPDGAPADSMKQTVLIGREPVDIDCLFAVNDPPGLWTITATDLLERQSTTHTFRLE